MKLHKYQFLALALSATLVACNDFLEQEPPSYITPDNFYNTDVQVLATVDNLYPNVLPGHGRWDYGTYLNDNNTDNQMSWSPSSKFGTGLWTVANDNGDWSWTNIRNINYDLNKILAKFKAGSISGSSTNIKQYIGEMYFMRAYCYFDMLQKFGDLPIITEPLADNEAVLVAADKRQPCNEVARFIINDLDSAITYMTDNFESKHTRISTDAAQLLKSRVALYEGSWLTNFSGTPFVPLGNGWPGAAKDYNAGYAYPSGSIDAEAKYFFGKAVEAAEVVAEKYKGKLVTNTGVVPQAVDDAENPYFNLWGTTDCSKSPEILLWRQYSKSLGETNNVEVAVQHGNIGTGFTRSLVEGYLMKDGKPIYASSFAYSDNTVADVAANRDPRLSVFLKVPGQLNCFKNMAGSETHSVAEEPKPSIYDKTTEKGYVTGYAIRKGGTFDKALCDNGASYNVCVVFRATEALLNYMEAEYMLTKSLTAGKILEYWRIVREKAGFTGDAIDPNTTIGATDMSKETLDWGAYTAGALLTDKVLYNIRRERRSELLAEGLRNMDLQRWRSYDQLIATPAHTEGIHLWNTAMEGWYTSSQLVSDGSNSAVVSAKALSEYYRPHEVNMVNNNFSKGLTWHMAHYLQPLPLRQFLLTASDHATISESPLYQNPYWPTTAGSAAEQ
ncbi:MAG: RagB/SusD family nutrient uptake outer membrane protein [Prevotella sp.]|nr:RagB/SusD family nutrient uptake outer membrane protein [Prevotella sp.]